jgi:hypothetical protein
VAKPLSLAVLHVVVLLSMRGARTIVGLAPCFAWGMNSIHLKSAPKTANSSKSKND